jgi:hypothetical protein
MGRFATRLIVYSRAPARYEMALGAICGPMKEVAVRKFGLSGVALVVAAASVALPASAHHSYAMFDVAKQVTVEGTVKQFMWTNPHSWIRLEVMDPQGNVKEWPVEMSSLTILVARGWTPKTVMPGDKIRMTVHPMKSGLPGGDFVSLDAGGRTVVKKDGGRQPRRELE